MAKIRRLKIAMILYTINCKFRDVVLLSTVSTLNAHTSLSTSPYLCDTAEMHSKLAAGQFLQNSGVHLSGAYIF